ncbi:MAG: glycosyltransferase family 4 protein, partial [Gammaproteobacteria bacterium]
FYRGIATRLFRLVDGFICVSPPIREDVLSLGLPGDRITVIPSGLDTRRFRPPTNEERVAARANLSLRDDEAMILSVGRLHPVKAYADLVRTAAGTPISPTVRFVVVGDGPERARLRRLAQGLPNVQFVGGVDRLQVINYLHAADMFVMPSVDLPGVREGTPTAVLEAMACGLPIVCTDSGGLGHVVRDGENGLVFSQRDVRGLRAALQRLLASPELRRRFGERNATLVRERDWRRTADRVTAFYEHILRMRMMGQRADVCES